MEEGLIYLSVPAFSEHFIRTYIPCLWQRALLDANNGKHVCLWKTEVLYGGRIIIAPLPWEYRAALMLEVKEDLLWKEFFSGEILAGKWLEAISILVPKTALSNDTRLLVPICTGAFREQGDHLHICRCLKITLYARRCKWKT